VSAPDKFLTDLAGLTEADSVRIDWRGYFDADNRFEVCIGQLDNTMPHGWRQAYGTGATVEEAMAKARADLMASHAQEAA
jgi:hypothetical protein